MGDYFSGNPYLTDPRFQLPEDQQNANKVGSLGTLLLGLGAGIAGGSGSGQPWFNGIAPGLNMGVNAVNQQQAQLAHMQEAAAKYQQMEDYRKGQEAHLAAEDKRLGIQTGILQDNADFNKRMRGVALDVVGGGQPGLAGFNPNAGPNMGPGATGAQGNAIGGIESRGAPNGGYGAVGPAANEKGNRAYGKYQVMDFNVGPWTKQYLGQEMTPQQFLQNPQAQDAVFNGEFGRLTQLAGGDKVKAAQMWFGGPGALKNPDAKDVNGMTVSRYGQQFTANGGAGPVGPSGAGPTMASLPPFQGPGMGDPAMQPGALPPGATPQVNMPTPYAPPAMAGAPPGMAVGDGGPPGSPAGAGPQVAQAPSEPQQPGSFDPGPMPQRDPRAKMLLMSPETKALGEAMDRDYQSQLELWKWKQTEARSGRNEELKLRQEADKLKQEGRKLVPMGPGQMYEPETDTVHVTDPVMGNSSYKLHGGTPPVAPSEVGTPEPENPNAPPIPGRNEDFLKTLPPDAQRLVKAYSEGRMPIPSTIAMRSPSTMRLLAAVQQYDPSFEAANYAARKDFMTKSTSGDIFKNIISPSNKFLNHSAAAADAYDKLGMNDGITSYVTNPLKYADMKANRTGDLQAVESKIEAVREEVSKFMAGSGKLTDSGRRASSLLADLSPTQAPKEFYATLKSLKDLMEGQIEPVAQQYKDLFKKDAPGGFIQPKGQEAIARIDRGPSQAGAKAEAPKQESAPKQGSYPKPTSKAERDALPSGTLYEAPDGTMKVRP